MDAKKEMMENEFRKLIPGEVDRFRELLNLFGEVFEDPSTYQKDQPSDDYLKKLLERDNFVAVVCIRNDRIVGGLTAYVLHKFEKERREIYIYDLAVSPHHRRQKVATGLILYLKKVAQELGAYVIFVQADQGDIPPIRLYESLGIREEVHHFDFLVSTNEPDKNP